MSEAKQQQQKVLPVCFFIMPFTAPSTGSYCDRHFDKIYNHIFEPAISDAGYKALRTDEFSASREIKLDIIQNLIDAPMCLCDLSTFNPNVFYELGIRQAFEKPVVLVQEKGQKRAFDISGLSTVDYRKERVFDEVLEDQREISKAIKDTENCRIQSLFSLLRISKKAKLDESNSKDISNTDIYYMLNKLQGEISEIKQHATDSSYLNSRRNRSSQITEDFFDKPLSYNIDVINSEIAALQNKQNENSVNEDDIAHASDIVSYLKENKYIFSEPGFATINTLIKKLNMFITDYNKKRSGNK
jgi:hypothetical protein